MEQSAGNRIVVNVAVPFEKLIRTDLSESLSLWLQQVALFVKLKPLRVALTGTMRRTRLRPTAR